MAAEQAEILRIRANSFLKNASRLLLEEEYDLAAFNIEQFCQLLLKYKLLQKTVTYPRVHSPVRLLRELAAASRSSKVITQFIESEIMLLTKVEDAYIVSRYLPRRYERREVEVLLEFGERVQETCRKNLNNT